MQEERQKVGRNKRSVSGIDEHAGNGLRPYPGLRLRKRAVSSLEENRYKAGFQPCERVSFVTVFYGTAPGIWMSGGKS